MMQPETRVNAGLEVADINSTAGKFSIHIMFTQTKRNILFHQQKEKSIFVD